MIELGKSKRQTIQSICQDSREVLVRAAMEGNMGRVWVPDLCISSYCLIRVGEFVYLIGLAPKGESALDLKTQIYESCGGCLIIPADELWAAWIEEQLLGQYRMVSRYALKKDESHFDEVVLKQHVSDVMEGVQIKRIDKKLYHQVLKDEWSQDFCVNYEDEKHFLSTGFGYLALKGTEVISGCSSYGSSEGMMEIEIKTRKDYRRQGLALACGSAFVLECLQRGLIPSWDAENLHLVELAEKMGYVYDREYQVYQLMEIQDAFAI